MINRLIARELLKVAKEVLASDKYEYIYDPSHAKRPFGSNWQRTDGGWSKGKQQHSDEDDEEIRRNMASDENTSSDILAKLADDESPWVRGEVANNRNAQSEVLSRLADDKENWWVREGVAWNKNTSSETLKKLAEDESWEVREAAKNNLGSRKTKIQ